MPKSLIFFIAVLYTIALTVVSLITLDGMPELGTEWDDKLYHIVAYAGLMLIWYFALISGHKPGRLLHIALSCVVFGIVIEAVQGKVTVDRIGDALDVVANVIGVLLGYIFSYKRGRSLS